MGLIASSPIFLFMAAIVEKYTVTLALVLLSALLWIRGRYAAWGIAWGLAIGVSFISMRRQPARFSQRIPEPANGC